MDDKEIITKLERVDQLVSEIADITTYCKNGYIEEAAEKIIEYKEELGTLKKPTAFSIIPTFKLDEEIYTSLQGKKQLYFKITVVLAVLMALLMVIFSYKATNICTILFFGAVISGYLYVKEKKNYNEQKSKYDASVKKYEETVPKFCDALKDLEKNKDSYTNIAKEYSAKLKETVKKCEKAIEEINEKSNAERSRGLTLIEELKSYDFISEEYYHLAKTVAGILKSNRADTYKEALNLAIAEEKEAIREAQREAEENRRFQMMQEEARRQSEEIARHNREMERQQSEANRIAENQARDAKRAAEAAKKQKFEDERSAREAQRQRCKQCDYRGHCTMGTQTINCPSFKPRKY